jgi:hypothetical protein
VHLRDAESSLGSKREASLTSGAGVFVALDIPACGTDPDESTRTRCFQAQDYECLKKLIPGVRAQLRK